MAERTKTVRIVRAVVGTVALAAIAVVGVILVRPYLRASPEHVAQRFLAAIARRDLEAARDLMTVETRTTAAKNLEQLLDKGEAFTLGELSEMGNYATVEYTRTDGTPNKLQIQEQEGLWRVFGVGGGVFPPGEGTE